MSNKMSKYEPLIKKLRKQRADWEGMDSGLFNGDMRNSLSELSVIDNHPADIGSELYQRERDIALHDNFTSKLQAIDAALERYQKGEYGICEHCGREIPIERLETIPYTTVCTECSRKEEKEEQHSFYREPVENELLNRPFARTFNDGSERNAFDGEDSWQAVARYGTSDSPQDLDTNTDVENYNSVFEDADEQVGAVEHVEAIPTIREPGRDNTIHYSTEHSR